MKPTVPLLGALLLAACGARSELSDGASEPVAECTWSFEGEPVLVSDANPPVTEFLQDVVDAVPTADGALIAWRVESADGYPAVVVRRLAWDLGANGVAYRLLAAPALREASVGLASGFGRTAVIVSVGVTPILLPVTGDGAPSGLPAKLPRGESFALRATPSGFDALVQSLDGTVELVQLDGSGAEYARTPSFNAVPYSDFSAVSHYASLADGSFVATVLVRRDKSFRLDARHFAPNGAPVGPVQTLATTDLIPNDPWRMPIAAVPGGVLVAWRAQNNVGSKLLVQPLSADAIPTAGATALVTPAPGKSFGAFDLASDGPRGALAVWGGGDIHLRSITPGGTPIGEEVVLPGPTDWTFDGAHLRVAIEGERGLVLFSAEPKDDVRHTYAVRITCAHH